MVPVFNLKRHRISELGGDLRLFRGRKGPQMRSIWLVILIIVGRPIIGRSYVAKETLARASRGKEKLYVIIADPLIKIQPLLIGPTVIYIYYTSIFIFLLTRDHYQGDTKIYSSI